LREQVKEICRSVTKRGLREIPYGGNHKPGDIHILAIHVPISGKDQLERGLILIALTLDPVKNKLVHR